MPSRLKKQGNKWTFRFYRNGKQLRKTIEAYTYKEDATTTMIYAHLSKEHLQNSVDKICLKI